MAPSLPVLEAGGLVFPIEENEVQKGLLGVPWPKSDPAGTGSQESCEISALSLPKTCLSKLYSPSEVPGTSQPATTWSEIASPGLILGHRDGKKFWESSASFSFPK